MRLSSVTLASGSSLVGATKTAWTQFGVGCQGVLVVEATVVQAGMELVLKSPNGTDINMSSSKVFGTAVSFGPLYLPAGEYAIKNIASSAIAVHASLHPTP